MYYQTPHFVGKEHQGVTVVRLTMTHLTTPHDLARVQAELADLVDRGVRRLVLDFKLTRYVSSGALTLLVRLDEKLAGYGGRLVLSNTQCIDPLLKLCRPRRFEVAADARSAAESLG